MGGGPRHGTGEDRIDHGVEIAIDVAVPEPQNLEAGVFKRRVPMQIFRVLSACGVLRSIDFHDKPAIETDEIENEAEQRSLAPEMQSLFAEWTKPNPEFYFLWRQSFPQRAGACNGLRLRDGDPTRFAARTTLPVKGRDALRNDHRSFGCRYVVALPPPCGEGAAA